MKRALALLLAASLVLLACPVLAEGFPLTDEPKTLTFYARLYAAYDDYGEVKNMKAYEEMTGVHINWINVPTGSWDSSLAAMLASGDLPDVIFKGGVANAKLAAWGEEGFLVDLAPYLEEYAPNFYAIAQEHEDVRLAVTSPDGAVYGLPYVLLGDSQRFPYKLWLNTKALDELGVALPTNTDELYNVLEALYNYDSNGDGEADHLSICSSTHGLQQMFYGTFGLMNRGILNTYVDMDEETLTPRIFCATEGYRKQLEYLHKLYAAGFIDNEIYTEGNRQTVLASQGQLAGVLYTSTAAIPADRVDEYSPVHWQVQGPDGYQISPARPYLHSVGNFVITSACKDVELALKWVDYFYSWEGAAFYHCGVPGEDWEIAEDGNIVQTEAIEATRTAEMTNDAWRAQFNLWPNGNSPSVYVEELPGTAGIAGDAAADLAAYQPAKLWPPFNFTEEENEVISTSANDINNYIANFAASVVAGEVELTDAVWNEYLAAIEKMGAADVIAAYEGALTRAYGEDRTAW